MACERDSLVTDALHQTSVASNHVGEMIDQIISMTRVSEALRKRHADRSRDALAERTGRRFDTRRMTVFRMTRRFRTPLSERLELLNRNVAVARQIQQCVKQHRAVPGRQNKPVPVGPRRIGRVEFEELGEQDGRHIGHAHRHAGMT